MIKNNSFGKDRIDEFRTRLEDMLKGISEQYDSIGFTEDEVSEITAFVEDYLKIAADADEEDIEKDALYVEIKEKGVEVQKAVYACRKTLRGLASVEGGDLPIYIGERFELDKKVPKDRAGYVAMAENILEGYGALPAEQPDFFVPAPPFERLQAALDKLRPALETVSRERAEARAKVSERRRMRKKGEKILRNVYLRAIAYWGDDDPRLLSLGMVHKSGIWTKKKAAGPVGNTDG